MTNLAVFEFSSNKVRVVTIDGEPWFVARDVLEALGSKSRTNDVKAMVKEDLGDGYDTVVPILDSLGRKQEVTTINKKALGLLLSKSRKPLAQEMMEALGLQEISVKTKEGETIQIIKNTLVHLSPIEQFFVSGYRIDLYFPLHRIAVECDELHHKYREYQDMDRQDAITKVLGCEWVRYRPEEAGFCIGKVLNQIIIKIYGSV